VATTSTCDWCGEPIIDRTPSAYVSMLTIGSTTRSAFDLARASNRDYHASSERDCFSEMATAFDALHDIREAASPDEQSLAGSPWRNLTKQEREAQLNAVLGDDRLTIRQIQARIERQGVKVWEGEVRSLVRRMYRERHLDREDEQWQGKVRYRYFMRSTLHGTIADLDRQFSEDGE